MARRSSFNVHAFDIRGHGNSGGKSTYINKFSDLVDDMAGFVKNLRRKNPGLPGFSFGHSMGGTTMTLAAINNAIGFRGIILSAPALVQGEGIFTIAGQGNRYTRQIDSESPADEITE